MTTYTSVGAYCNTGQNLFDVSFKRQQCLDQKVSLCPKPKPSPEANSTGASCRFCCQRGFVGGYNSFYPPYAPMTPDNGFLDRQDFPTGSFLPVQGYSPPMNKSQPPAGCGTV